MKHAYWIVTSRLPMVLLLASILPLAQAALAKNIESNLTKSFPTGKGGKLVMDVDRGPIQIETRDADGVSIEVFRSATETTEEKGKALLDAHYVTFSSDQETVTVHARLDNEFTRRLTGRSRLEVRYVVTVPKAFHLDLKTSAGSIQCGPIQGEVKARTSGGSLKFATVQGPFNGNTAAGSIRLEGASGAVHAQTSGGSIHAGRLEEEAHLQTAAGSITISEAKKKLTARTSGGSIEAGTLGEAAELVTAAGSIRVTLAEGPLDATTSGGSITIDEAREKVSAQTAAGSITATLSAQPQDDCRLVTSGGAITLYLDPELAFDVEARASGGRVTTELPITTTVVGEHSSKGLRGKLNGGGKALTLRTSAGNIAIRKK